MRFIEPEELAKRIVDMLSDDDCRRYVLEDLTEYYSDLKFDSPSEYEDNIRKFYNDDI